MNGVQSIKNKFMISYIIGIGCSVVMASVCALLLVKGVDTMKEKHPDYKGEDFLNWDNDSHYEGDF